MRSFFILFAAIFCFSVSVSAQAGDWDAVRSLKSGKNIIIEAGSGNVLNGKFSSATADSITFRTKGRSVTLGRADVSRVYLTRRKSAAKRALWGAAAGAGIGLGVGAVTVAATKGDPLIGAAGFLYGIPAGAVIGAVTTGRKRGDLIYSTN